VFAGFTRLFGINRLHPRSCAVTPHPVSARYPIALLARERAARDGPQ
jgi:hypothetical protein